LLKYESDLICASCRYDKMIAASYSSVNTVMTEQRGISCTILGRHDNRRRELRFQVSDFMYLKISPTRGFHRFKIRGKVAPKIHWTILQLTVLMIVSHSWVNTVLAVSRALWLRSHFQQ
jgi:hypothetical protein